MYQFTTTNVINSTQDLSSGLPLWSLASKLDEEGNEEVSLYIKRIGKFDKKNIKAIYKSEGSPAVNEEWTLDFTKIKDAEEGDPFTFNLYIGLTDGSNNFLYANDTWFKGKPWFVNFTWKEDATETATALYKMIKKFAVNVQYDKLFDIKDNKAGKLTITAVNGYQRFKKIEIAKIDREANHGLGEQKVVKDLAEKVKDGFEGFGTFEYLRNNLRLPTYERTNPFAKNQHENPIPGCLYNEYVIHMCVDRGTLGNNAVGDQVTSHTTHVFYVNQNLLNNKPEGDVESEDDSIEFETGTFESMLERIAPEAGVIPVTLD